MSGFFEPPPPRPEPPARETHAPEWLGPPANVLGVAVPIRLLLARTRNVAMLAQHFTAYPNGVRFQLVIARRKPPEDHFDDPLHRFHMLQHTYRGGELPDELLRFGVQLADGSKATTLDGHPLMHGPDKTPQAPVLVQHGGVGGGAIWEMGYWLWPLPPAGPLALVVEWPSEKIPETRVDADGAAIHEAASHAETLWPENPEGQSDTGSTGIQRLMFARDPAAEEDD